MTTLDDHDRALIDDYKAAITPPDEVVQSNWEVIAELAERQSEEDEPTHDRRRWWWLGVAAAVVAIVSYVELRASIWQSQATEPSGVQSMDQAAPELPARAERRDAPGSAAATPRAEPAPPVRTPAEREATVETAPSTGPEPSVRPEPTSTRPSAPAGSARTRAPAKRGSAPDQTELPEPTSVSDIRAEMRLLGRARAAIAAGDFARALSMVDRHDREHPRGTMREEAAMLRVGALCEVGPKEQWIAARRRFDRDFPDSPLRTHLDDDCFE